MGPNKLFQKGSEWRRWDLHVHSPLSILNNHYPKLSDGSPDWDSFISKLENIKGVSVIGITDYFFIDGYKKIQEFRNQRLPRIKNIDRILPNIELRLDTFVVRDKSKDINFHVIFSDELDVNIIEKEFINALEIEISGSVSGLGGTRQLTKQSIREIGKVIKEQNNIYDNDTEEEAACKNITVSLKKVQQLLRKDIFKGKFLFVLAGNEWADIDWKQAYLTKKNFLQTAHILETGSSDTISWALGRKDLPRAKFIDEFGALKPCAFGSDAHSIEKVCEPKDNKYCWIKADPTFEGLKQIVYEPEARIYIGEEPSRKLDRSKIIKNVLISKSNSWFEDNKTIEFNEDLVSIIGGKGSGKTAILDLIALAAKSYRSYEDDEMKSKSFLKKALPELKGTKIKIEWAEGAPDEITIDGIKESEGEGKVRYLPQDFIDQLCSEIGKSELEGQIENVIFQKVPPENKADQSDFNNYKDAQLGVVNKKKERINNQIRELNKKIYDYGVIIESKDKKSKEIIKYNDLIRKLENEMKGVLSGAKNIKGQKEIIEELNSHAEKKIEIEKDISELKAKILKINEVNNDISQFIENANEFVYRIKDDLKIVGIDIKIVNSIKVILNPHDINEVIKSKKDEINENIKALERKLKDYGSKIQALKDKMTIEKSKQDKIKNINESLSLYKKKSASLNEEINRINRIETELPRAVDKRDELFIEYFNVILEEERILKDIYSPLENTLQASSEENEKLFEFTIMFNSDINSMSEDGHRLIDLRAEGKYRQKSVDAFRADLKNMALELDLEETVLSAKSRDKIKEYINSLKSMFGKSGEMIRSQLKKDRYTEQDYYNWLFETKFYRITYSIRFNGVELGNLSPGLKGVALLILYLELDKEDKRPILIDQPEENLDNRSVYNTLKDYFRKAKHQRQTIIVTHNPNLVVNTDSEQVIVANFDRATNKQKSRIRYISGALENTFYNSEIVDVLDKQGIREHVCEILEGGKEAFEKREQKYGFMVS